MPYIEVTDEQLKQFDPDGKLSIYTPEDTTGLKDKANALLGEKKSLELELVKANADLKEAKLVAPGTGDAESAKLQSLLDDAMSKNKDWEDKHNGLLGDIRSKSIDGEADRIAATLTTDTSRASLLSQQIRNRITLDNGSFSVLDEKGNPTISSMEELTGQIKTQYPFLVDGSKASGGGAQGGSGGAGSKPFSEMNATERSKFANEKPTEYAQHMGAN